MKSKLTAQEKSIRKLRQSRFVRAILYFNEPPLKGRIWIYAWPHAYVNDGLSIPEWQNDLLPVGEMMTGHDDRESELERLRQIAEVEWVPNYRNLDDEWEA